jgi:hypothetical protein
MSRIDTNWEPDDQESFLRSCAFQGNVARAVAGKKGRKFFQELEAALLALPEKRLLRGVMANTAVHAETPDAVGVCALGAVALSRAIAEGKEPDAAIAEIAESFDPDEGGWYLIEQGAAALRISMPLAYAVVEENDEGGIGKETPEDRYSRVLAWVRERLREPGNPAG